MLFISLFFSFHLSFSNILHVGNGYPHSSLAEAIAVAAPGDTILIHAGTYAGGLYFENVQGEAHAWITIAAAHGEEVVFSGGNNAWQFADAAYIHVRGIIFEHQLGNGLNFDDGGTDETPAHHLILEDCIFRDMNASGNNDLLKMSGIDTFEVRNCVFLNGAEGGSGIDMVGCHEGVISDSHFENMGSNAIQAKGGTRNIRIERNFFRNCGHRAVNMGGSTGLPFFRPSDATYEAADLKVYANIFVGSTAPVAFVGCINSEVVNNTIWLPDNWVLRILQETVDTSRFFPCGNNTFRNNLIVIDNSVNVVCNIGPNTAPETFTFSHNLWFHTQQSGWGGPVLPTPDDNSIINRDPLLTNPGEDDFTLLSSSPAIAAGFPVGDPVNDFSGSPFLMPRSIGAFESGTVSSVSSQFAMPSLTIVPNPSDDLIMIRDHDCPGQATIIIAESGGKVVLTEETEDDLWHISVAALDPGLYFVQTKCNGRWRAGKFVRMD